MRKPASANTKGKTRQPYLRPIYGEDDEIAFHYAPSRACSPSHRQRTTCHPVDRSGIIAEPLVHNMEFTTWNSAA
jgi:hypothetical protein